MHLNSCCLGMIRTLKPLFCPGYPAFRLVFMCWSQGFSSPHVFETNYKTTCPISYELDCLSAVVKIPGPYLTYGYPVISLKNSNIDIYGDIKIDIIDYINKDIINYIIQDIINDINQDIIEYINQDIAEDINEDINNDTISITD